LYPSSNIIRIIIPRRLRWASHAACTEEITIHMKFCQKTQTEEIKWKTYMYMSVYMGVGSNPTYDTSCHVYESQQTGFGLVIGFTELLQNVTTNNYSANNNSHTLQFTTARTKYYLSAVIFTNCRLVTASMFTSLLAGNCLTTNSYSSNCCLKTLLFHNHSCSLYSLTMDHKENAFPNSSSIVASRSYHKDSTYNIASQLFHCCVLWICCGHYIATAVAQLLISQSLPSIGSICHSILNKKEGCVNVWALD
jgi:hypothetical protein